MAALTVAALLMLAGAMAAAAPVSLNATQAKCEWVGGACVQKLVYKVSDAPASNTTYGGDQSKSDRYGLICTQYSNAIAVRGALWFSASNA